jgi:REP element-mobilizing transposase RayT
MNDRPPEPAPTTTTTARHHRCSIRLRGYDYSRAGAYFVTICAQGRECLFGEIVDGEMLLNEFGGCVVRWWDDIPRHFVGVDTDAFVVMPNHVHGIIVIVGAGLPRPYGTIATHTAMGAETAPLRGRRPSLGNIVAYFKYQTTKTINEMRQTPSAPVWQRNYYEHIIRDEEPLNRIREYIINNPLQWALDRENPVGAVREPPLAKDEPWRV